MLQVETKSVLQSLLQDEADARFQIRTHLCYASIPLLSPASISVLLLRTPPPSVNLHPHGLSLCPQGTQPNTVLRISHFLLSLLHISIPNPKPTYTHTEIHLFKPSGWIHTGY